MVSYVFEKGKYPRKFFVRTPLGLQEVTAFSHDDLITLIECFGKLDYKAPEDISVVVDFGSNIGISALYFLTRNPNVKIYLFEPVPHNVERLKENLKDFADRYELSECAIGVEEGLLDFACDDTGRYGGLIKGGPAYIAKMDPDKTIQVKVVRANKVLEEILDQHESLDILKIDIEGYENKVLNHLSPEILSHVRRVYVRWFDSLLQYLIFT